MNGTPKYKKKIDALIGLNKLKENNRKNYENTSS